MGGGTRGGCNGGVTGHGDVGGNTFGEHGGGRGARPPVAAAAVSALAVAPMRVAADVAEPMVAESDSRREERRGQRQAERSGADEQPPVPQGEGATLPVAPATMNKLCAVLYASYAKPPLATTNVSVIPCAKNRPSALAQPKVMVVKAKPPRRTVTTRLSTNDVNSTRQPYSKTSNACTMKGHSAVSSSVSHRGMANP